MDPFIVSPQFATIITKRSKQGQKRMDRDSIDCWLWSVDYAKQHQIVFQQSLAKITKYFKPKSRLPPCIPSWGMTLCPIQLSVSVSISDNSSMSLSSLDFDDDSTALSSDFDAG
jgi:hypothetical protein